MYTHIYTTLYSSYSSLGSSSSSSSYYYYYILNIIRIIRILTWNQIIITSGIIFIENDYTPARPAPPGTLSYVLHYWALIWSY